MRHLARPLLPARVAALTSAWVLLLTLLGCHAGCGARADAAMGPATGANPPGPRPPEVDRPAAAGNADEPGGVFHTWPGADARQLVRVHGRHEYEFAGVKCHAFNLALRRPGNVTARLRLIQSGESRVVQQVSYDVSDNGEAGDPLPGQVLVLLEREPSPDGVERTRITLGMSVPDDSVRMLGVPRRVEEGEPAVMETRDLPGGGYILEYSNARPGEEFSIYAQTHVGGKGADLTSIVERSKHRPGWVSFAVTIQWNPRDTAPEQ